MDFSWLIPLLSLITLLCVLLFAVVSRAKVEERRHDPNAPSRTSLWTVRRGEWGFSSPSLTVSHGGSADASDR